VSGGSVVVVGGGLAGITAALDCAEQGAEVTLVEVRPRLGGAIYSFAREGITLDNGQHVFLRCCTAYRGLLARLGSERHVRVQPRLEIPVLRPGRPTAWLRRGPLPAPLHLAGTLARYAPLSRRERLGVARAALALGRLDPADPRLDQRTLGDWLSERGQSPRAVAALWDLIALPTLNLPAAQASLALGAFVFQRGLLADADAADVGLHVAPLSQIVDQPARAALRAAGVEVRLGWRAERVRPVGGGFEVEGSGEGLSAEATVVALPHQRARELLPAAIAAPWASTLASSPIVNLHLVYDRPVLDYPFAAGVDTPVQYVFDRSAALDSAHRGMQYLAVSLSGADQEMRMSRDELRRRFEPALRDLLPRVRDARLQQFLVTREHAATFSARPGTARLRPPAATALRGLALAGSWTATGWPATLESAVLSGHAAAREALGALGRSRAAAVTA
jgi:squalene-associated FAD-dependent desaturase